MTRRYAELMNEQDADQLQEAADDVSYLTSQGLSPTEAIAKVASAAGFPLHKTRLLTYAYTNGVAAEKRASGGGPLERLAEFPMPDPLEIQRLVYGEPEKQAELIPDSLVPDYSHIGPQRKIAAFGTKGFLPKGMATFDADISQMSRNEIRDLFGLAKTAEQDSGDCDEEPNGFSISRTTIRIGLCPKEERPNSAESPKSLQDALRSRMPIMSPEQAGELEIILPQLLGMKKDAMIEANAEADDAFTLLHASMDEFGHKLNHRHLEPSFKRAGLASVHAYYPDIAAMLGPYLDEINAQIIKEASYILTDVTNRHPWVKEAEVLHKELQRVADLTVAANQKSAEYRAVWHLYENREKIKKSAAWGAFLAGAMTDPLTRGAKGLFMGNDQSKLKSAIRNDVLDELDDPLHDLNLQDIATAGMLNDFATNDEILSAFDKKQLLRGYNALLHTAPKTMRDKAPARALLQQYMTQGRMAPTELMPALQMNKLVPRTGIAERRENSDA